MKLLLDSADVNDVREWCVSDAIAGVTTNPSLVAKQEKKDYKALLFDIASTLHQIEMTSGKMSPVRTKHLSIEPTTLDPKEILYQIYELDKFVNKFPTVDLYFKVPVMKNMLPVISEAVRKLHVKVNATACMTGMQAKMASDAGAQIVSFFYRRAHDYLNSIVDRNNLPSYYSFTEPSQALSSFNHLKGDNKTRVICGSIREISDVYACFGHGADYVTAGPKVLEQLISHPKTTESVNKFQEDIEKWLG